jgi:predicted nucleic acid-binding Zn ribbon protein
MIKRNAQDLGSILKEIMEENTVLKSRIAEHRVLRAWREILGEGVNKYTSNLYFKRGVLFVHLNSSVLRAELMMNKKNLIEKLNEYAGMAIIRDIVLR